MLMETSMNGESIRLKAIHRAPWNVLVVIRSRVNAWFRMWLV